MITRRAFVAAMKNNGYSYNPKTGLLYCGKFDDNSDIEVWLYIIKHKRTGKEYANISVQKKFMVPNDAGDKVLTNYNYIPFDHVMLLLSMVKDMRKWWLA